MKPADSHLGLAQFEALLAEDSISPTMLNGWRHLEECLECRQRFLGVDVTKDDRTKVGKTPGCPEQQVWASLAADLLPTEEASSYWQHAAACDYCGPLLQQAIHVIAADPTPREKQFIASLPSADPDAQRKLAGKLAATTRPARSRPMWNLRGLQWALSGALFITVIAGFYFYYSRSHDPTLLVAQAYSEHRVMEMRVPQATFRPMASVQRGDELSRLQRPALLRLELEVAKHDVDRHPEWLTAKAMTELLEWRPDLALTDLQRALVLDPNSPIIMADVGAAYFERARLQDTPEDYARAVESFNASLRIQPGNTLVHYNRAFSYEQLKLYDQAIEDWEWYLKHSTDDAWSQEARRHLADDQEQKKKR